MSKRIVLWQVDVQQDFMLPGGKLYVPGAEKIIPNIRALVRATESNGTLIVSSACAHAVDDPEFQIFGMHCVKGSKGAQIVRQGLKEDFLLVPNDQSFALPAAILDSPQIIIEKQMLDVFSNPHASEIVERLGPEVEFVVYGVVTEFCVKCASEGLLNRGRKVWIVGDAIETLNAAEGNATLTALQSSGAHLIDTDEAVRLILQNPR